MPLLFIYAVISIMLAACSSSSRIDGYVYYRLNANPSTLDPALITDVSGASIAAKLFNGLVRLSEDLEIISDIAERWEISDDGLTYRFFLNKGIKFSNGREVVAGDFKYSFERVLDPESKSPNAWVFEKVDGSEEFKKKIADDVRGFAVVNDYIFEIRLKKPFSPFLNMLTTTPAYVALKPVEEKPDKDSRNLIFGTGPFVLKQWQPNINVVLQKRDDYFGEKPVVKGIVYKIIPEDLTAITEFELGGIDVISLPASAYSRFRNDEKWHDHILSLKSLNTYYLGMNASRPPFNNKNIRRAVSYAIDRDRILKTFYEDRGRKASGPVPDLLRKWTVSDSDIDFNAELAAEIITKEGLTGIKVNMYVTSDQEVLDLAEIIQSYLSEAGINVMIKQLEWSSYKAAINKGEPDMFWLSWWADYPDAENFLFPLFHSANLGSAGNRTRYVNKEADLLIEKGQHSIREGERIDYYKRAEEIIISDLPMVFFWHRTDYLIKQPWIKGYKVYPIYTIDKGTEIEITSIK